MIQPSLELTPFGANKTNGIMSPIDSIHVGTKMPELTPRTRPTDLPTLPTYSSEQNGKAHVPADPDPDPSLSDSSSNKSNFQMTQITVNQLKRNAMRRKPSETQETGSFRLVVDRL